MGKTDKDIWANAVKYVSTKTCSQCRKCWSAMCGKAACLEQPGNVIDASATACVYFDERM